MHECVYALCLNVHWAFLACVLCNLGVNKVRENLDIFRHHD